jgi:flagellar biosynthesis GTPase FlhF
LFVRLLIGFTSLILLLWAYRSIRPNAQSSDAIKSSRRKYKKDPFELSDETRALIASLEAKAAAAEAVNNVAKRAARKTAAKKTAAKKTAAKKTAAKKTAAKKTAAKKVTAKKTTKKVSPKKLVKERPRDKKVA